VGNEGLKTYLMILGSVAFVLWFLYRQIQRGVFWGEWLQRIAMQIPKIGRSLELLALSRFSWSLHLALETEMALRRALRLAFLSTRNAYYTQHIDDVLQRIRDGNEITETLASTHAFPSDFLDAVRVGEQTGQLAETLGVLSEHYQEEGRAAVRMLTRAAGGLVWLMVTGLIVMLIFRLFGFYMQQLNDALKGAGM
jgi:type IV pilus assembly protein PilC